MSKKMNVTAVLIALLLPGILAYLYFVVLRNTAYASPIYTVSRIFLIMFPCLCVVFVDKAKFPIVRFKKDGIVVGVASGLFIGAGIVGTYFLVLKGVINVSEIRIKAEVFSISADNFIFIALFYIFVNSAIEEYYWRWFTYSKLRTLMTEPKAIILSALGFSLHHVIILVLYFGVTFGLLFSCGVFIGGAIWAYLYQKYDSIWPCFISHAIVDAALMINGWDILIASA